MEAEEVEGVVEEDVEVVEEDAVLDIEEASDEVTQEESLTPLSRRPVEAEDVLEVEEAVEDEYVPRQRFGGHFLRAV